MPRGKVYMYDRRKSYINVNVNVCCSYTLNFETNFITVMIIDVNATLLQYSVLVIPIFRLIFQSQPEIFQSLFLRYHYTKFGNKTRDWWTRDSVEEYFPPLALYQPTLKEFLDYHGYTKPLQEPRVSTAIIPYMGIVRSVVDRTDPVVFIWTLCLAAFLPHFKALRFRFSLFGI